MTKPLNFQKSWSAIILIYPKAKQRVAVLLLPATSLSGGIGLLAFNRTSNHTFGNVGIGSGGTSEATGCCLSRKAEPWQTPACACTSHNVGHRS